MEGINPSHLEAGDDVKNREKDRLLSLVIICSDLQEGAPSLNLVLAESIQSSAQMENSEMNAQRRKSYIWMLLLNFSNEDLILCFTWSHPTCSGAWLRTCPNYKILDVEAAVYA